MQNYIETLQTLYLAAFKSENDPAFYQAIHDYIDYIVQTPELSALIKRESFDLKNKQKEIRNDPSLRGLEKNNFSQRAEWLSFYGDYISLYTKIYLVFEDSKHGVYLSSESQIMLYYFKGIESVPVEKRKFQEKDFIYKHEKFENNLKSFHSKFWRAVEKMEVEKDVAEIPNQKPEISFDADKSVLKIGDKKVEITLKNQKPDGHYVLEYIFENGIENPADYVDILKLKFRDEGKNNMSMYRACNDINAKVSKQAGIANFLEIHVGKTGWVQVSLAFR
jgi:hypothetical protein